MNHTTLVAAFRSNADAQAAASDLQAAGIDRSNIYVESSSSGATTTEPSLSSRAREHEGGVAGWFKSLFGAEESNDESRHYQQSIEQGGSVLSVDASEVELNSIETILNRHNPINVTSDEQSTYLNQGAAAVSNTNTANAGALRGEGQSIPVVQEDLQVGKRNVMRGGVRIISRVVETPVEENIGLREEHIRMNRQAVNRPATEADFAAGRNQAVELEEYAEEAVVSKQARVVEEIQVGKDVSERTQTVKDTLRHTEVEVEQLSTDKASAKTSGQ